MSKHIPTKGNSTWAQASRKVIEGVLQAHPNADKATLRKLLQQAYPFGPRKHHPYKVWCEEVRAALGEGTEPSAKVIQSEQTKLHIWNANAQRFKA